MESDFTEFQYFVDLFWVFLLGWIAVRVVCGFYGDIMYWLSKAFGGH